MDISFASKKLEKLCSDSREAMKVLGADGARKLRTRLADLEAADTVSELVAGRPHPLTGKRARWVSSPGETIADVPEERGWTQAELAERLGFTRKHVNDLIQGRTTLTPDAAIRLATVLGSTAGFWLRREAQFRAAQEAQRARQERLTASLDRDFRHRFGISRPTAAGEVRAAKPERRSSGMFSPDELGM
jgi:addiction module HigA family antidote